MSVGLLYKSLDKDKSGSHKIYDFILMYIIMIYFLAF